VTDAIAGVFVHAHGICETKSVGVGTRVWAFSHVLAGATIGVDCNICDLVFIENDVVLGNRVTIKSGAQLWDGVRLEDDVFIGPNATFTNDPFPRSKRYGRILLRTVVRQGASVGANATVLPGVVIGERAMVGAGAVVTRDVPANAIVTGNPARVVGYVGTEIDDGPLPVSDGDHDGDRHGRPLRARGVRLIDLPHHVDPRGDLSVMELDSLLPFTPSRLFFVYGVPDGRIRGEHAHRECHQFLLCVAGSCRAMVDDGTVRDEATLDSPHRGLYVPPGIWATQYQYSADAILTVLASHRYDEHDYIRTYEEFRAQLARRPREWE
jgi:UDP-2-acetamido-3-amino-2,3-dideoxy-glucuronate N-acetyltransferase